MSQWIMSFCENLSLVQYPHCSILYFHHCHGFKRGPTFQVQLRPFASEVEEAVPGINERRAGGASPLEKMDFPWGEMENGVFFGDLMGFTL